MNNDVSGSAADLVIDISGATVRYGSEEVLHDFNWQVRRGEHWFILGPNGAGKTTLVKTLMGFKWPLYGSRVAVLGEVYGQCNLVDVRRKIAWVSPFLLKWTSSHTTARDVVLSGIDATIGMHREPTDAEIELAMAQMRDLHCEHVAAHAFEDLSSGEQLKVLIGRAMMQSPELLILDEACVHLDMKTREHLLANITALTLRPDAPTVILITHRLEDITRTFTRGMILKDGRMVAQGAREEIITAENLSGAFDMPLRLHRVLDGRFWVTPAE